MTSIPYSADNRPIEVSVIVPAFNEENRIRPFLDELIPFCRSKAKRYEVIVVDDGSRDATSRVIAEYASYPDLVIRRYEANRGKGYAVREGMKMARGRFRVFMDADGSYAPEMIERNFHYFSEGYDVVIGSRFVGQDSPYRESPLKKVARSAFNGIAGILLSTKVMDKQCGFKMFTAQAANELFAQSRVDSYGMDLEILFLASKKGYKIKEAPVEYRFRDGSKVRFFSSSIKIILDMIRIRLRNRP